MTITIILKHFQSKQHILCLTFQHIYPHNSIRVDCNANLLSISSSVCLATDLWMERLYIRVQNGVQKYML